MIRLGFGTRLIAIFLTALMTVQLIGFAAFMLQRSQATQSGITLPLPDQTAALVELLEKTPKAEWPLVLRASNSSQIRVSITDKWQLGNSPGWSESALAEFVMRRYLTFLGDREVRVAIEPTTDAIEPFRLLSWVTPGTVEIEVGLKNGQHVLISTTGFVSVSVLGIPPGVWAGVLGLTVAVLALFLVRRESKPLLDLAAAVDRLDIGSGAQPFADMPRSAPEIRALLAAFNRLTERIAALLRGRMALVGGISHDLRTYVTRLRLRARLIPDPAEREKTVSDLEDMMRLLDDSLLAYSDGGRPSVEELIDLAPLLDREVEERRHMGFEVVIETDPEFQTSQVLGDPLALRRMLANIIDNALKYGSEARISGFTEPGSAVIEIDDRGPGIPAEQRDHVMEPFVRMEMSRNRQTGGAGLGLTIAQTVIKSHGGTLKLSEAPNTGLRATIKLPLYP